MVVKMNIYIYIFAKVVTCIFFIIYVYQMFNYMGVLLESRKNKSLIRVIPLVVSGIFTASTFTGFTIPVTYMGVYIIIIIFFYIVFKGTLLQILFASGNFIFHILVLRGAILGAMALLHKSSIYNLITNQIKYSISLSITLFFVIVVLFLFRKLYSDNKVKMLYKSKSKLRLLVITQAVLNILLLVSSISYYYKATTVWSSYYNLISCGLVVIVFYIIFNYLAETSIRIENEINLEILERQLQNQLEDYYAQMKYINNMRRFKHDYNNVMLSMGRILENGDINDAKRFLSEISSELKMYEKIYKEYSNNPLIQAILTKIGNKAIKEGIDFSAEVIFPEYIVISDLDICRVFSNIMDNAIEALMRVDKVSHRYIKIKGGLNSLWFTLVVENSFNGDIVMENNNVNTIKSDRENHGFGIQTVKDIMSKVGGIFIINPDVNEKIFTVTLHIPCKEENR